jgi:hypothetical protein
VKESTTDQMSIDYSIFSFERHWAAHFWSSRRPYRADSDTGQIIALGLAVSEVPGVSLAAIHRFKPPKRLQAAHQH